jgi:hypothetical protein
MMVPMYSLQVVVENMDRDEIQENFMENLIANGTLDDRDDDVTATYLNDSGEGAENIDRRCRGCSSAMPSDRGLGLMESCKLTRDIGSQTSGESDLPRFGALDEVKPLRPACLFLIMMIMGYNGVPNSSAVISSRWLSTRVT